MNGIKSKAVLFARVVSFTFLLNGVFAVANAAEDPITIGAPIPLTGPFASDGEVMQRGIELAISDINVNGGLLGRQLQMTTFDIGDLTPDKLQSAASSLIDDKDVEVLINGYGAMGPDIPAFCPHDQPYLHNAATPNVVDMMVRLDCTNIFMATDLGHSFGGTAFRQVTAMDREFPNKRIMLLHGPYDWELDETAGVTEAAEAAGWEVVATEEVSYGTSEWGGILGRIRDSAPALVFIELLDPDAVWRLISQFNDNPAPDTMVYAGYAVSMPAFDEFAKEGSADGVMGMTLSSHDPSTEQGQAFMQRWQEAFGENPPYSIAAQIYDHVKIWANAVEKVGNVRDFGAINQAISETSYQGLTGTFNFNDKRYIEIGPETVPPYLLQVQDGEVRPVMRGDTKLRSLVDPVWSGE